MAVEREREKKEQEKLERFVWDGVVSVLFNRIFSSSSSAAEVVWYFPLECFWFWVFVYSFSSHDLEGGHVSVRNGWCVKQTRKVEVVVTEWNAVGGLK